MAKMIDIYGPMTASELDKFIADGVGTFGRYLGRKSMGFSKGMTQAEVALIKDRGKQIVSIYEDRNNYAAWFTKQQGILDAQRALEDAKWIGQPYNTPIYLPADFDVQPHDLAAIKAYLEGARQGLAGLYKLGFYGGYFAVENVEADYYGQTAAWSNGKISAKAHWYQGQIDTKLDGFDVDIDTITGDIGEWPEAYPEMTVKVLGQEYKAIDVHGDAFISWTAFRDAKENITKAEYGDVEIGGEKPNQVTYMQNTYIIYTAFTNMQHQKVDGQWVFERPPETVTVSVTAPGKPDPVTVETQNPPTAKPEEVLLGNILKHLPSTMDTTPGSTNYALIKAIAYGVAQTK